uniref:NADH-ubiquinone oxidoreductase chain 6 n=1 Tax=Sphaerobolus stellatus TaxID=68786 RepID=A0A7D4VAH0_9AGAM|nr:NADH dehydrogenase subunit 6 [Sphaerobolus stellatus]
MTHILLDLLAFASILSSILVITSKNPVIAVIYLISVFINAAGYLLILGVGFIGITYVLLYVGAITILFLFVIMSINIKLTDIMEAGSQYTQNIPLAFSIGILFIYEIVSILPKSLLSIDAGEITLLYWPVELLKTLNSNASSLLNESTQVNLGSFLDISNTDKLSAGDLGSALSGSQVGENLYSSNLGDIVYSTINPNSIDANISPFLQLESLGQELYTHGASWLIICSVILLLSLVAPTFITRNYKNT